jgi:16S rRNA processing protein RimM
MTTPILIAKILSANGIKGEVKIIYFGDNYKNLEKYSLFDKNKKSYSVKIIKGKNDPSNIFKKNLKDQFFVAKIFGVDDRDSAELLAGTELFTLRENFSKTKKNEFYVVDLIGLKVLNMQKQEIGKVVNVLDYGAGTLIEIDFLPDFIPENFQQIANFPFKNEFFPIVDIENKFIIFDY